MKWVFALTLVAMCGCYANTMMTGRPSDGMRREERMSFFMWGLAGEREVDLDEICPDGAAVFGDERTFVDGVLTAITLGIYSPRTRFVECAHQGESSHAG